MNLQLLLVDPQNDFCDLEGSALPIAGADADMQRAAALLARIGASLSDIHVTLDSHTAVDIAHPAWWSDAEGRRPEPFTTISPQDLKDGRWRASDPAQHESSRRYVQELADRGRHELVVWPEHCLLGTWGHNVHAAVMDELNAWQRRHLRTPHFAMKGLNPGTEHYSAVQAEVPDPSDPATLPDRDWLARLSQADVLLVAGEALSHCVANTVRDLVTLLGDDFARRIVLISDCSTTIAGFEGLTAAFVEDMEARGLRQVRSDALVLSELRPG